MSFLDISLALSQREDLLNESTDSLRVFDGDGEGAPGIYIDQFGKNYLVSSLSDCLPEKIGEYLHSSGRSAYWKKLTQGEKESPELLCGELISDAFLIKESGVNYEISYDSGYSQGIFLDQRENRIRVKNRCEDGDSILNTFAYTGAFSICAALGGGTTTTLDLSQSYLDWAKRNFMHNQLDSNAHYFCKGDAFHWLNRFTKQGRKFEGIILDPPTFSRDAKGNVFRVEKHYNELIHLAEQIVQKGGWILATTNCRKLDEFQFLDIVQRGLKNKSSIENLPMPKEYTGEQYLKSLWIDF